jgi:hypothetical protein
LICLLSIATHISHLAIIYRRTFSDIASVLRTVQYAFSTRCRKSNVLFISNNQTKVFKGPKENSENSSQTIEQAFLLDLFVLSASLRKFDLHAASR